MRQEPPPSPEDVEERWRVLRADAERRNRAAVARCRFPVYGLDDRWQGRRWIGGFGSSNSELRNLELAHGDPHDPASPLVRVDTTTEGTLVAQTLVQTLWLESGAHTEAMRSTFEARDPVATWDELTFAIDRAPQPFRSLRSTVTWVATGAVGDVVLSIVGRHVDPTSVGLVRVDDLEPYLAGTGF
jgi:hypothetical protein